MVCWTDELHHVFESLEQATDSSQVRFEFLVAEVLLSSECVTPEEKALVNLLFDIF